MIGYKLITVTLKIIYSFGTLDRVHACNVPKLQLLFMLIKQCDVIA